MSKVVPKSDEIRVVILGDGGKLLPSALLISIIIAISYCCNFNPPLTTTKLIFITYQNPF